MRSNMGAYINRLEHAINNLNVSNTNQQSAESIIRDVEFCFGNVEVYEEPDPYSVRHAAMLAQANAVPQSVLSLLK